MVRLTRFLMQILLVVFISYLLSKRNRKITYIHYINRYEKDLRHILIWTEIPNVKLDGQKEFLARNCERNTCYFTKNRTLFKDIKHFDAIVFNLQDVIKGTMDLPKRRGSFQKYIFAANESADKYPVCDAIYDEFFNWTWTYRRYSTISYQFIHAKTADAMKLYGNIKWKATNEMKRISRDMMNTLSTKSKAAAIFLDECNIRSKKEGLLKLLENELSKYNLTIDIYGDCGQLKCKRRSMRACNYRIRRDYFFYLALEDYVDEDYVTDIVMNAIDNYAVPIVSGGANYLYFMPQDSFLDISQFTIPELAEKMHQIIIHKHQFYDMFRWRRYYIIQKETPLDVCTLCEGLTTPRMLVHRAAWSGFREWWNPNFETRC